VNELKQIEAFRRLLSDYQLSEDAKKALAQTNLALFVGPSSSGRNTIINELLKSGKYHYIVSDTTRKPRVNNGVLEQNGREYWFRTEDEVLHDLEAGQFLEAAIIHEQQVSGISMRELREASDNSKIAVNEIEVVGADNIHAAKPDALFLFIIPPSFDEWMARMSARGTLPVDEVRRRLQSAVKEISIALERPFYHFIVNDTFMHTAKEVDTLIGTGQQADDSNAKAQECARTLLSDTETYLQNL
jgi:guanylate kinase